MERQALIELVKVKLDELSPFDDGSDHPIDKYLDPLLDRAAEQVLREAPLGLLRHDIIQLTTSNSVLSDSVVTITIPDSVLRVVSVNLPGWVRPITVIHPEGSSEDAIQRLSITRSKPSRPTVVSGQNDGKRVLRCYTHSSPVTNGFLKAINYKKAEALNEELKEALVSLTAFLFCLTVSKDGKMFYDQYQNSIK